MNGEVLKNILNTIASEERIETKVVSINTKSGRTFTISFEPGESDCKHSFERGGYDTLKVQSDTGTAWIDVSSIESVEI